MDGQRVRDYRRINWGTFASLNIFAHSAIYELDWKRIWQAVTVAVSEHSMTVDCKGPEVTAPHRPTRDMG